MGEWDNRLFGCFGNLGMCVFTWFVPCYTFGKTAEAAGTGECLPCTLVMFVPFVNLFFLAKTRTAVRESKGIDGGLLMDCLTFFVCGPCALIQTARENLLPCLSQLLLLTMGEWQQGLFGCFTNLGLCFFSYILPCFTHGKTAEMLGEDCVKCGLVMLVPFFNLYTLAQTRGRVRDAKAIPGTFGDDCLLSVCCAICVIIQNAAEMNVVTPLGGGQSMARA